MTDGWLFLTFARLGALAFGGGYVIIPPLYDIFVTQTALLTPEQFGNLLSVSQMTPGPTSINVATYVGYIQSGFLGAVITSIGLVFPSFFLTGIALFFLNRYQHTWPVQGFLKGARLVAFVMILYAVVLFGNMSVFSEPWPLTDVGRSLLHGHLIMPPNWHINGLEACIALLTFYFIRRGCSVTFLLVVSAFIGSAVSFLWG